MQNEESEIAECAAWMRERFGAGAVEEAKWKAASYHGPMGEFFARVAVALAAS